ncbi:aldehyde dehydrogenase family protein [Plastorhodobacter daqingensis]|uniref:Aldehyde dehydrogenase family protein n=1 Tax=Plastorhodobacter daqingensis TaxID=1387281 RepID=A0ABW2UGF5_9RHOB
MSEYTMLIGGQSRSTADHRDVENPATGEIVGRMPMGSRADLDDAVAAARAAFPGWAARPDAERQAACNAIAEALVRDQEELARLITQEQGKPLDGLGSRFEMGGCVGWTQATAALTLEPEVIQDNEAGRIELHRKPLGVVGSITPWNWPVLIAIWHVIPAIRTGNTVVIKPSPFTPLSTIRLIELMDAVLPPGVVNVITGPDSLGAAMSEHPGIDKIVFTGSIATGRKVMAGAAETLKRLTLELGGNDAGIVLPDADPKAIAQGLFWGAFINTGQTCGAMKRLYVHDSLHDRLCDELVALAQAIPMGNGLSEGTALGPLSNRMQFDRVRDLVEDARAAGGRILCGGAPGNGPGHFYPITIVSELRDGTRLVDEEQFGPVLPVIRYSDVDEVIARANDNPHGLGGSIWTSDPARGRDLAQRLECGTAWVNKHGAIQPNVPFGGVKSSGIGVEFGLEGLKEYTSVQTVWL